MKKLLAISLLLLSTKNLSKGSIASAKPDRNPSKNNSAIAYEKPEEKKYAKVAFALHSKGASNLTTVDSVSFTDMAGHVTTFVAGNSNKKELSLTNEFSIKKICAGCDVVSEKQFLGQDGNEYYFKASDDDIFIIEKLESDDSQDGEAVEIYSPVPGSEKIVSEAGGTEASIIKDGNDILVRQLPNKKFSHSL